MENWLINSLIKCSEFNSVNSAGENSPIYNRGGTVLAGKEILLPGDKI